MRLAFLMVLALPLLDCGVGLEKSAQPNQPAAVDSDSPAQKNERERMVREQIAARGVRDSRVLEAMRHVVRHRFVPPAMAPYAYRDQPLPIGHEQTISQPYIVAFMTEALELERDSRVLEIGTGSGYQAAVLAEMCRDVYSIEIVEPLGKEAAERLKGLGYQNVHLRVGDGYRGWPEAAPFDAIIVTAAPEEIPSALLDQLAMGGRMVLPVGRGIQTLLRVRRTPKRFTIENLLPVRFVPMVKEKDDRQPVQD